MGVIRKKTVTRGTDGGTKFHCDVCSVDITSTVRINCASPQCQDYDLCVPCFAQGKSSKQHNPSTHPYYVIEQNSVPIFTPDWGADEELLLLEGAEIYGLGSWADIADHIGGFRSKDEVRDHYIDTYINSPNFPLPERADPNDTRLQIEISKEEFQARKKRRIEERKEAAKQQPPSTPKQKPTASVPACHEVQGYMPGRLEFEHEYLNDAEEGVQSMSFEPGVGVGPNGTLDAEMELKMIVKDIYNSRLDERVKRKRIIFEHDLLDYRKNIAIEKKKTKEERDLYNKAKPFAQMMNHADFVEFTRGLEYEHNLRLAISQLQEWRNMGLGDLKMGQVYETEKAARQQRKALSHAGQFDKLSAANKLRAAAASSQVSEGPTMASLLTSVKVPPGILGEGGGKPGQFLAIADEERKDRGESEVPEASANPTIASATSTTSSNAKPKQQTIVVPPLPNLQPWSLEDESPKPATRDSSAPFSLGTPAPASKPEVNGAVPDLHLLTPEEIQLCNALHIQPKPYLVIKEHLIKEALKNGGVLRRKDVKGSIGRGRFDNVKVGRIWEFMVRSGWIGKGGG